MIEFKTIELKDKEWVDRYLQQGQQKGCEYSFANNYIWRNIYYVRIADVYGCYLVKTGKEGNYAYPVGNGEKQAILQELIDESKQKNESLRIRGIIREQIEEVENWFPGQFQFELERSESDYIYTVEKLSKLAGKKLHGKRNHIARFKDNEHWSYEPITKENIEDCFTMNQEWCEKNGCKESEELQKEYCAVKEALHHFFDLKLEGGLLRLNENVIAYTIGEPLTTDTYVVHIEKAFSEIQGAYPMINQQFILHNAQNFIYVNREEDTGDLGLRKAKLSYYPDILLDKYTAILIENKG